MGNLIELKVTEMKQISGGVNIAYEVGYIIGSTFKKFLLFKTIIEFGK
jgi:hypothetical protein